MTNKIFKILQNLFLMIVIIICIGAIILPLSTLFEMSRRMTFCVIVFYMIITFIFYRIIKKINIEKKYVEIISVTIILLIGLFLRIGTNYVLKTEPVSDFKTPHNVYHLKDTGIFAPKDSAIDNSFYQTYYSTFPAWFPYMKVVSSIYDIFGEKTIYIKILNWGLYVLTSLILYTIGKNCFSKKNGLFAIILFALFPSHIVYSSITTPDHISIFLITAWVWIWAKLFEYRKNNNIKKIILFSILNILCICLINLFKPLSIFGILVFICTEILCYIKLLFNKETKKEYLKTGLTFSILFIVLSLLSLKLENKILYNYVEKTINTEVVDATGLYMLWGYSIDSEKNYNSQPANVIYDEILAKNNNDVKKSIAEATKLAKEQFVNNLPYLPKILYQKYQIIFLNEQDIFLFANNSNNIEYDNKIALNFQKPYIYLANGYIAMLFCMIIIVLEKEIRKKEINPIIITTSLIIIGYICILIFGGVQPRYKTLLFGPICFLAANSLIFRKKEKDVNISNNTML